MDDLVNWLEKIKALNLQFQANPNPVTFRLLNDELKKLQCLANKPLISEKMIQ